MSGSALLGHQPLGYEDRAIYKSLLIISPSSVNPDKRFPFGPPAPANAFHHSHAPNMIIGTSFTIALVIIITGSRLWVRAFRSHALGADDVAIIPAAIGCVTFLALNIASESAGCFGKHLYDCTYVDLARFVKVRQYLRGWFHPVDRADWSFQFEHSNFPIFYFTVFCVKISITLANRRITGMTSKKWQMAHGKYLAILACLLPLCVFLNAFQCSPAAVFFSLPFIGKLPDPRIIKCLDKEVINLTTRLLHIVTDWLLLPVPLIIIWRLQMPFGRKIRLMLVFCVGLMSSIAGIMRNILSPRVTTDLTCKIFVPHQMKGRIWEWRNLDDYYEIYFWDVVDIFFATIVASLPALNGVIDIGVSKLMSWESLVAAQLIAKIRSIGTNSRVSESHLTRLSDQTFKDASNGNNFDDGHSKSLDKFEEPIPGHQLDME